MEQRRARRHSLWELIEPSTTTGHSLWTEDLPLEYTLGAEGDKLVPDRFVAQLQPSVEANAGKWSITPEAEYNAPVFSYVGYFPQAAHTLIGFPVMIMCDLHMTTSSTYTRLVPDIQSTDLFEFDVGKALRSVLYLPSLTRYSGSHQIIRIVAVGLLQDILAPLNFKVQLKLQSNWDPGWDSILRVWAHIHITGTSASFINPEARWFEQDPRRLVPWDGKRTTEELDAHSTGSYELL